MLLLAASCGKKKWSKTTPVSLKFEVTNFNDLAPGTPGTVTFDQGRLYVEEIRLVGDRKQSDDIDMLASIGNNFDLVSGISGTQQHFDIPQGTYTDFRVQLDLKENGNNPAIKISGTYTTLNTATPNVQFSVTSGDLFKMLTEENDGTNEVVLIEGNARILLVEFNIREWFSPITQSMWENADHNGPNENSPITIDDQNNLNLYNLVLAQIANSLDARFQ